MRRIVMRGVIHANGRRYFSVGLMAHSGAVAEITTFDDGAALAQIGDELFPLVQAA